MIVSAILKVKARRGCIVVAMRRDSPMRHGVMP
jgi:hypothetical protein